ncbi:hypothetical protein P3S68_014850 [Capsicum galapagoense]
MYILALVVVFFIAILVEFLSHSKYIKEDADNVTAGLLQTTLYGLRIGLAYVVMLAVMSFNAGVFLGTEAELASRGSAEPPFDRKIYYLFMIKIIFYVVIVSVEPPSIKFSLNIELLS